MFTTKHSIAGLALVAALSVGAGGALAQTVASDYGSAELVQAGHGPGGPPTHVSAPSEARSPSAIGRDYGSASLIQLGHGPGGPRTVTP